MTDNFNQDLLRIARQARGWSQSELSSKSGVSQANLSKLENGLIGPTDEVLDSVSKALGFPIEFFFQHDRVIGLPMSVQYRKRASVGQKAIERLEAELNIRILHLRRLLDAADLEPELSLPRMDVDEFGGDPERIADLIRRTWLVPSGPIRDLVEWVERAGCIVVHCDFAALKVDGFTVQIPDMPPCIFLNRNMPADRQRFSLAHELGHVVMHQVPSPDMENEANVFASALLMPARDLRPQLSSRRLTVQTLAALKPVWRTSMAALLYRAKQIGAITDNQSQYLWRQMSSMGYRKAEPPELDLKVEMPTVLPEIVRLHIEELGYDVSDLAQALRSSEEDLRSLHPLPQASQRLRVVK
ncbi:XRE family transcriptional regulator [uncultured Sulfitobacter sp.]|jgi:Zn-dependent peptidase ImmA (M78 family)/DNA-binding XRE family transcriptional regulator|uniref:helix-turn-helix domain-containing protein n=1 Tax=Celeribacter sp. TaxID=1890673 RepID=UPI002595A032|nr:XRE family transcriptional regulator [uncultured Sulfitobacter sp.]MBR9852355.1 ImmA/IrrE family metallo-endopeptidase [Paracoccaceae bacterium]